MRGHFSIEWMAQSSLPAGAESVSACSTQAESLPGFYCRQKPEPAPEQERGAGSLSRGPEAYSWSSVQQQQQQTPHSHPGNKSHKSPQQLH